MTNWLFLLMVAAGLVVVAAVAAPAVMLLNSVVEQRPAFGLFLVLVAVAFDVLAISMYARAVR